MFCHGDWRWVKGILLERIEGSPAKTTTVTKIRSLKGSVILGLLEGMAQFLIEPFLQNDKVTPVIFADELQRESDLLRLLPLGTPLLKGDRFLEARRFPPNDPGNAKDGFTSTGRSGGF